MRLKCVSYVTKAKIFQYVIKRDWRILNMHNGACCLHICNSINQSFINDFAQLLNITIF